MSGERTNEELMAAYVKNDDMGAFQALFDHFAPMLTRMLRRQVRNQEDVGEIVQQTFLQFHRARYDFQLGRTVRPWLLTIAFNLKREHFRRKGRKPEAPLEVEPPAPEAQTSASGALEQKRDAVRLREAIAQLPEGQRSVIEFHWFEEMSFPEIAEMLGLSVSAAKVRAHRGYKALRRVLQPVTDPGSGA